MPTYVLVLDGISQGPPGVTLPDPMAPDHWAFADWVDVTAEEEIPPLGSTYQNGVWTIWSPSVPTPSAADLVSQQLSEGYTITSTSGAVPTAAWRCDTAMQDKAAKLEVRLLAGLGFPGGATTHPWSDVNGNWYQLSAPQLLIVLGAISAYVDACDLFADGFPDATLPVNSITVP